MRSKESVGGGKPKKTDFIPHPVRKDRTTKFRLRFLKLKNLLLNLSSWKITPKINQILKTVEIGEGECKDWERENSLKTKRTDKSANRMSTPSSSSPSSSSKQILTWKFFSKRIFGWLESGKLQFPPSEGSETFSSSSSVWRFCWFSHSLKSAPPLHRSAP